jgi:hypothetical protein
MITLKFSTKADDARLVVSELVHGYQGGHEVAYKDSKYLGKVIVVLTFPGEFIPALVARHSQVFEQQKTISIIGEKSPKVAISPDELRRRGLIN